MRQILGCIGLVGCLLATLSCTETTLYSENDPRRQADRVALSGRVCSEDPAQAQFPVRVVMILDRSAGPLFSSFDVGSTRIEPLKDFVQTGLASPSTEIAVLGLSGRPRKIAPEEGDFTRNPGELFNAVTQTALAQTCVTEGRCRDWKDSLRSARALIEGDLATSPDGQRVLTQYVVIMVSAGPASPMALGAECCDEDDVECLERGDMPSPTCQTQQSAQAVDQLRKLVSSSGAAGLRFHTIHLAAEADPMVNDQVQSSLEAMAFAGGGTYQRFNTPGGLIFRAFDLLGLRTLLRTKLLVVSNLNAKPGANGPEVDSDTDGLSDREELELGSAPENPDTDGDGITDYVEVLVGLRPLEVDEVRGCLQIPVGQDQDLDGLTDCDEELLGTSATLVDSDGDGLPDKLELIGQTDYVARDAEEDIDGDGVTNGDELLLHSDPRSTDVRQHLSSGYRYEIEDEGVRIQLFGSRPKRLTGITITDVSLGTTPGVGALDWDPEREQLRWRDALDGSLGPPVSVDMEKKEQILELPSSSWAPIQEEDGKKIVVEVSDPALLPGTRDQEAIRIVFRERQCLNYTVRNVRLVGTRERSDGTPAGTNDLVLFLAQSPEDRPDAPGPFKLAQVPVVYRPPNFRTPDGAIIEVKDSEFVRPIVRSSR